MALNRITCHGDLLTKSHGQIGSAIVPMIARGIMLGPDKPVILHLLDIEQAAESLNGIRMEMTDVAFPLLKGVVATTEVVDAWWIPTEGNYLKEGYVVYKCVYLQVSSFGLGGA